MYMEYEYAKKASSHRDVYRFTIFNLSVCVFVCLPACLPAFLPICLTAWLLYTLCCVKVDDFTDCESCSRPISTNPEYMGESEYGLMRGACFVARRPEVVAVAGLLWNSWCVFGAPGYHVFLYLYISSNAHGQQ